MSYIKDRWFTTAEGPDGKPVKHRAARHGQGSRWQAVYEDESGKRHSRCFARKVDAQSWLNEQTAATVAGRFVDPKAGAVKVRDYARRWEKAQVFDTEGTARVADNALRLHLLPALGDRSMRSVRRSDVQGLVKALSESYAPGTVRNIHDVTSRVFAAAVEDRVIAESPCRRVTLPKVGGDEVVPPTVERVAALAGEVPARYRAVVVLLSGSGLRIGEALGLRIADVDFLRRTVRVERQRHQGGKLGPPKGGRSRTVPVGQVVIDALAAHLAAHPSREWLFTTSEGEPLSYRAWKTVWGNAQRRLQAAEDEAAAQARRERVILPVTHAHDLRHFYASMLIGGGASVKQVQTVLGHASAVITLRVYAHLWPDEEDRTRTVADATLHVLRSTHGPGEAPGDVDAGQDG